MTRRLTILGFTVSGVLICMIIGGQLAAWRLLTLQDRDASLADFAGHQRRLCETLSSSALFIHEATSLARQKPHYGEFHSALLLLERSEQEWRSGKLAREILRDADESFVFLYREVESRYRSFAAASSALMNAAMQPDVVTVFSSRLESFVLQKEEFLLSLEKLVAHHGQLAAEARNTLRIGGFLWRGIALLGICWAVFFVFQPTLRRVATQAEALAQTRDQLQTEIVERDRAKDALRESEERYRAISETSMDYAFAFRFADDGEAYFEWLTPSFFRLTGYSVAEILKEVNPWRLYVHPDDLPLLQDIKDSWSRGQPGVKDFRILTKGGEVRWVRSYTRPILNEQGVLLRVWGATQDITEYKEAETALRESQERFDLATRGANDGIWDWNSVTNEVFYSDRLKELLGFQEGELEHTVAAFTTRIHPEEVAAVLARLRACLEKGFPFDAEFRWQMKSGEYRWFQSRGRSVTNAQGVAVRMAGSIRDITERKEMETSLRANEERFRSLSHASPVGIFLTDERGESIYTNPRWQEITGLLSQETIGQGWAQAILPEDRERVRTDWKICTQEGREYRDEFRLGRPDGQMRWVASRAAPIYTEAGTVFGYVGTMEDITEQKCAEGAMQRAKELAEAGSRAKSEFLANMSHELRTPMNGVIGITALLLDTDLSPEQKDLADTVKSSAESLLTILNDILDFSKVEAGKLELDPIPFALRAMVEGVVKTFVFRAAEKDIALRCNVAPDTPDLFVGDSGRIRQILINLIGNALKFTERGEVTIEVKNTRRVARGKTGLQSSAPDLESSPLHLTHFVIRDTGIGIAPEKQRFIFDAFAQADGSTSRQYGGTGLGLTICRKLAELMGGEIWVESEVGQGSAFHFTVQLTTQIATVAQDASLTRANPEEKMETRAILKGKRVLLVEDNAVNRKLAVHLLRKLGCEVVVAHHGKEALLMVEQQPPFDAVLMDCQMPEMDGFGATSAIRAREQEWQRGQPARQGNFSPLPIIAMTANAMTGDRERCLASGMDDYIAKPIRAEELQTVLGRWLLTAPRDSVPVQISDDPLYKATG